MPKNMWYRAVLLGFLIAVLGVPPNALTYARQNNGPQSAPAEQQPAPPKAPSGQQQPPATQAPSSSPAAEFDLGGIEPGKRGCGGDRPGWRRAHRV